MSLSWNVHLNFTGFYFSVLVQLSGLFIDKDIPHWKSSKKMIMQALQFKALKTFVPIFHEESLILVRKLTTYANSKKSLHPPKLLELATYSSILRTMLGVNFNVQLNEDQPFIDSVHKIFKVSSTVLIGNPRLQCGRFWFRNLEPPKRIFNFCLQLFERGTFRIVRVDVLCHFSPIKG